ncbi:hypothetical protein [Methanosarcina spelaei]|uniref:hypothetical protein n=1 Tax=Methanosarcina spelaei TaxID=1036679 RepID=UPI001140BEB5|nr:hypothetical protein [Methanosarcina spelaei]
MNESEPMLCKLQKSSLAIIKDFRHSYEDKKSSTATTEMLLSVLLILHNCWSIGYMLTHDVRARSNIIS